MPWYPPIPDLDFGIGEKPTSLKLDKVGADLSFLYATTGQISYTQMTSPVSVSAVSEAASASLITAPAFTGDGSTQICIEWQLTWISAPIANGALVAVLFDGGSSLGQMGAFGCDVASQLYGPITGRRYLTPSATSHTFKLNAFVLNSSVTVNAAGGGSVAAMPGYLRISRAG